MWVCVPPTLLTAIRNFNLTCNAATIITYLTCCAVCNVHLHFQTLSTYALSFPQRRVTCLLYLLSLDCCCFCYLFILFAKLQHCSKVSKCYFVVVFVFVGLMLGISVCHANDNTIIWHKFSNFKLCNCLWRHLWLCLLIDLRFNFLYSTPISGKNGENLTFSWKLENS